MRTPRCIWIGAAAISLASCTVSVPPETIPTKVQPKPVDAAAPPVEPPVSVVHVIGPGQTLWRIAKVYGVDLTRLAEANGIRDAARVEVGTSIRIPGAVRPLEVPPYPLPIPPPPSRVDDTEPLDDGEFLWPVDGGEILSAFGAKRRTHPHAGLDIRGFRGQEILAARAGRVVFSGTQRGYGKVVILDHGDGLQTVYAHALTLGVQGGDHVERGQAIATVGRSGNATTDHLHFEVRRDGAAIDPSPHFRSIAEVRR